MPATKLDIYAGSTHDLSFGGGGFSWAVAPTPQKISDASNIANDPTYGLWNPSFATPRTVYSEFGLASIPLGIVTIASIQLACWVMATGTAGIYDTDISGMVRPSGSGTGATGAYFTSPLTHTSETAALEIFRELLFGAWAVNPATSVAWTLSDLAAGKFGLRFVAPATDPVNNASIKLGRFRLLFEGTSSAANTEGVRVLGSMPLRLFGRPLRPGKIVGPAQLADVGLTETFFLSHQRGRAPDGPGWGTKSWRRRPLVNVQKRVELITGQTTLDRIDLRTRYTRLLLPGLTTIGFSLDGQGLPILHSGGGGPACTRAQVKYVEQPGNPTDHVSKGVTENLLANDARGYCIERGGETNDVLNSTFSAGAGNVFTSWTKTETGTGTVTEDTARVGFDEIGLRRSCRLDVGITDASVAQVAQALTTTANCRLLIRYYNDFGAAKLAGVFQRASDSKYWNDTTETWDVAPAVNRLGADAGGFGEFASKKLTTGADTLTITIGYLGEAGTVVAGVGFKAVIWSVDRVEGTDHVGTPIVTVASPVTRIEDVVTLINNEVVRYWGHERGFSWTLGFLSQWNAADMAGGEVRVFHHIDYGNGNYAQIGYQKGVEAIQDRYYFAILSQSGGATAYYAVDSLPLLQPLRGRLVKLSGRWIGPEGELDLAPNTIAIAVNDDYAGGTPAVVPAVPTMDAVSTGYHGHMVDSGTPQAHCDEFVRQFDASPLVLRPEEQERRPA